MNKETLNSINLASDEEIKLFLKCCNLAIINLKLCIFLDVITFGLIRDRLENQADKIVMLLNKFWKK